MTFQPELPFHPKEAGELETMRQDYIEDACSDIQDARLYSIAAEALGNEFDEKYRRIVRALGGPGLA